MVLRTAIRRFIGIARKLIRGGDPPSCVAGASCDLRRATIINYNGDPRRIVFGERVKVLGEIEVFQNGRISIGAGTFFGRSKIFCADSIDVGEGCWIADHVFIMDSDLHPLSASRRIADAFSFTDAAALDHYTDIVHKAIKIGRGSWIGVGAIVLKGVTLGEGCIVGAGSVVTEDVPDYVIVAGNPARSIGTASK